ncbi:hypothetical protein VPNG_07972 [Cytospora leucostoma]|uniref:Transmembrane protein n=1 Tax=Cytospora leucostoma TaxID=1230097 RepID=A0A423WAR0_9PEZI|nr:hypothetical protein VPNG_07972 [Cytospora leucostoma]
MGFFGSNEGEGSTMAERYALIGILCFAFAWIPVFIAWKIFSVCRGQHRSPEQEVEAGNMPVTTNPPKPNRDSFQPRSHLPTSPCDSVQGLIPGQEPMALSLPHDTSLIAPGRPVTKGSREEHLGKRRPMPTQPVVPKMRIARAVNDDALLGGENSARKSATKATKPKVPREAPMPDNQAREEQGTSSRHLARGESGYRQKKRPQEEQTQPQPRGVGRSQPESSRTVEQRN